MRRLAVHRREGPTRRGTPTALLALALVVAGTHPALAGGRAAAPSPSASGECRSIDFVGVRGTGQPLNPGNESMGTEVFDTFTRFRSLVRDRSSDVDVVPYGAPYDSVDIFTLIFSGAFGGGFPSVDAGKALVTRRLLESPSDCVVAVGYSQGAWIVGEAINDLAKQSRLPGALKAVVVFGDPRLDPGFPGEGSFVAPGVLRAFKPDRAGIPYFPPNVAARSYCIEGDPVCNSAPAGVIAFCLVDHMHCTVPTPGISERDRKLFSDLMRCGVAPESCPHGDRAGPQGRFGYRHSGMTAAAARFLAATIAPLLSSGGRLGDQPIFDAGVQRVMAAARPVARTPDAVGECSRALVATVCEG